MLVLPPESSTSTTTPPCPVWLTNDVCGEWLVSRHYHGMIGLMWLYHSVLILIITVIRDDLVSAPMLMLLLLLLLLLLWCMMMSHRDHLPHHMCSGVHVVCTGHSMVLVGELMSRHIVCTTHMYWNPPTSYRTHLLVPGWHHLHRDGTYVG